MVDGLGSTTLYKGTLAVQGMTCSACTSAIIAQVGKLDGVGSVEVSLVTSECHVEFQLEKVSLELIRETVEDCGFDAQVLTSTPMGSADADIVRTVTFKVLRSNYDVSSGFSAESGDSVSMEDTEKVGKQDGILSLEPALEVNTFNITYDENKIGIRDLIYFFNYLGYDATVESSNIISVSSATQLALLSKWDEIQFWKFTCLKACVCAIVAMALYMWIPMIFPNLIKNNHFPFKETFFVHGLFYRDIIGWAIATYSQFRLGIYFYKAAWSSMKHGSGTMDTLIALSTSCAYLFSIFSIIHTMVLSRGNEESPMLPNVVFDTSVMLIAFISFGKLLENKAKAQTSSSLSKLIQLTPSKCIILQDKNNIQSSHIEIETNLLQRNDIIEIKPGMKIPADGIIIQGESEIDESLMTGESILVHKQKGSQVIAGSLNGPGHFYFKAINIGDDTKLAQIIQTMKSAQLNKAPIQNNADYLASIFVPTILCLSIITFITWITLSNLLTKPPVIFTNNNNGKFYTSFQIAISVIVVACPCALGLATPTAIMVGTGIGAQHGVLIKGGDILERFNTITKIVFDKTGTITTGQMTVQRFIPYSNDDLPVLPCIMAAQSISEHPVAKAIVNYCGESSQDCDAGVIVTKSEIIIGKGVRCECEYQGRNYTVTVGHKALMTDSMFDSNSDNTSDDFTKSYVSINDTLVGKFEIRDSVKEDVADIIQYLQGLHYDIYMVTGDSHGAAMKVAQQVGIAANNVYSGVTPSGKCEIVESLQADSVGGVAFVGDGINDSPVLVTSDIGVALSTGTDIAMEAADIVVLGNDQDERESLKGLIYALDISAMTFSRVKWNLFWALGYNIFMIPIAMGILVPWGITIHPMVAGLAMALSSVFVVLNSLRLKSWKPPVIGDEHPLSSDYYHHKGTSWIRSGWRKLFGMSSEVVYQDLELQEGLVD
ncbi:hypothetical protein NCAS_0C05330 [Naumovozyma castellii]|uniref:P-type Cu(+) transporter n=1 Tax=Naumovozyma castellii TaxID=27288 RepID=G0VDG1_NAUCA|nr:hypothetical protein NCAS_0C05330 [Naumovozyma castellii CBS 4309]CCC69523.1 hypothetical protein NCAS_0C05330 [Naumovozyma castellii CBS 4309]